MKRSVAAALFALCAAAGVARADIVRLASGEAVEGRIIREDSRRIVLEMATGRMTIDRTDIISIERAPFTPPTAPAAPTGTSAPTPVATPTPTPAPTATPAAPGGTRPGGGRRKPPPAPAPAPAFETDARVAPALAEARPALADATKAKPEDVRRLAEKLTTLGARATPTIAAALATEEAEPIALALEQALGAYPSAVASAPLLEAVRARGLGAGAPLLRATGAYGGAEGAALLIDLLGRAEEEAKALSAAPTRTPEQVARQDTLKKLRSELIAGLAAGGEPAAVEKLLALAGQGSEEAARAAGPALRRALTNDPQRAEPLAAGAMARLEGLALGPLLEELGGLRLAPLLDGAARALQEASRLETTDPRREALQNAALMALRGFLGNSDSAADPRGVSLVSGLLQDPVDRVRLSALIALAATREKSIIPRLIDLLERDESVAVQQKAHAALVRFAEGVNHGDAEAWRAWWDAQR